MIETAINLDIQSEKPVDAPRANSRAADEMTVEKNETDTKSNSPPPKASPKKSPKSPKSAKSSPKSPRSLSTTSITSDLDGDQTPKPEAEPANHSNQTLNQTPNQTLNQTLNQSTLLLPSGQIKSGQLFGPFTDPIQWLTIRHSSGQHGLPKEIGSLEPDLLRLFRRIQMANSADEQNLEIVVKNNKFYFRAMQAIDLDAEQSDDRTDQDKESDDGGAVEQDSVKSDKRRGGKTEQSDEPSESLKESPLFAWFSSELSSRLPTPAVNVINGNKRYYCTKCNSVFTFPNPTILHILFACNSPAYPGGQSTTPLTGAANERSSGSRSENNESSEKIAHHSSSLNSSTLGGSSNKTSVPSATQTSGPTSSSPLNNASEPLSYTPLNGSVSLANSKILKNLEAKLCKQFTSTISNESSNSTTSSTVTNQQSSTGRASSGASKPSKPTKKRAFDIDSLVNNVEQPSSKKQRSSAQHVDPPEKKSTKNEKVFKTPLSTASTKANTDHLTNSTLINSLNSPLANAANGLGSSFLNPFSFLDPTSLAAGLPSAFHKVENLASSVNSPSSMSSTINKSLLNSNSLAEQSSLLNAAAMFGNVPNFANPFGLAAIYAQQQRNLLQSMFGQSGQSSSTGQLASSSAAGSPSAASLNYLQSQLSNPLFASQSLASLGGLNSLGGFNGLNSLLAGQPSSSSTGAGGSLSSGMSAGLQNSLANSLFAGLSGASASSLAGFNPMASGAGSSMPPVPNFNHSSGLLEPFAVPQSMPAEKSSSSSAVKKKKSKEPSSSPTNSLKSGGHQTNQQQLNSSNRSLNPSISSSLSNSLSSSLSNSLSSSLSSLLPPNDSSSGKLNSLLHPSYFQFLSPSLAALSSPQSNWCAKCNISFRMTSDLVYHMRSQHKDSAANGSSESSSPTKRKRDENKLFCQICGEGFKGKALAFSS